jgi:hypothetical protein
VGLDAQHRDLVGPSRTTAFQHPAFWQNISP